MPIEDPIRVLLVDDHAVVRSGYRAFLEQSPGVVVVAEADTADSAYHAWQRTRPHVVVMDIMLGAGSGIAASQRILSASPGARILVCSMLAEPVFIQHALDVGVLGAIGKDSPPQVLREAVLAVARGQRYVADGLAQRLAHAQPDSRAAFQALAPRDFEIVRQLVLGTPIEHIGESLHLSAKTIANRLSLVRTQLGVQSDIQLVRLAAEAGLLDWRL